MGIFGTIWNGIKGAATGFLTGGGPIGAAIGGGLGLASSLTSGGGSNPYGGSSGGKDPNQAYASMMKNDAIRRAYEKKAAAEGKSTWEVFSDQVRNNGYTGFLPSEAGGTPYTELRNANPDFNYWEPYTTQSDINASNSLGKYEGIFQDLGNQYGDYQSRAFDLYEQAMQQSAPENLSLDWGEIGDLANRNAYAQNYWMTHGTAGTEGSVQGDIQAALGQSVGSGFGTGSGAIGNALSNTFSRVAEQNLASSDRNLGTFGGIMQADLASQRQAAADWQRNALAGMQNFTGAQLSAIENAYGAGASAAELPFARSGERQTRSQTEQAWPYLLESLKSPSWLEQQGQLLGTMGTVGLGSWLFGNGDQKGAIGGLIGSIGGLFGGGGQGGGGAGSGEAINFGLPDYYGSSNPQTVGGDWADWYGINNLKGR